MLVHSKHKRSLRRKAGKALADAPEKPVVAQNADLQGFVHEYSVHQTKTEMRNEELIGLQKQLEESRAEFAELYDFAPVGYLTLDGSGLVTRANLTACGLLGIERSLLIGKPLALFVDPGSRDAYHLHRQDVSEMGRSPHSGRTSSRTCQLVLKKKDGALFNAQMESIAVVADGRPAVNSILTDITGRIQAEAERRLLEAQLRQAQKMEALGLLSGGIAHDFNNILAAIIGFTEMVSGNAAVGSRDARRLARVLEGGIRGRELVRQMLVFSSKAEQEKKPVRVCSVVDEAVAFLREAIPTTIGIRVNVSNHSDLIFADPTQMQQVLMNLCTNAAFAMRASGGVLDIDIGEFNASGSKDCPRGIKPGSYVKLTVRDTGTGIPPDTLDKIFDPFFTTKGQGEGTGLGLSVVRGIVNQHGGHVTVESVPGKGSAFTVYLPKATGGLRTDETGDDRIPTGSERILFVDDEEALTEMAEDLLVKLGYMVTARTNSSKALALIREDPSRFDLVITDQTMPNLTGIELAKRHPCHQAGHAHYHVHGLQRNGRCRHCPRGGHQSLCHETPYEEGNSRYDQESA